jgi:hypothetical protein
MASVPFEEACTAITDGSVCTVAFNVMPGRPLQEELRIREFRIGADWIEAEFDRSYQSSMINSPSHLTFVSALIQIQKVTYVYACHRLGFNPTVTDTECLKVWPTSVNIVMRDLVREEEGLVHRMNFTGFRKVDTRKYLAVATSRIGILQIDASAMLMLLRDP